MANWPDEISMESFRKSWDFEGEDFWLSVFDMHKEKMQIKNSNVAIGNLEKIFTTTFRLSSEKGFQVMSLRDLSRETGISVGGLYAYIGSKNDLASVIEGVLRKSVDQVTESLSTYNLEAVKNLEAIIYAAVYMMEILRPWYYFCFMELKGLPREQQQHTLELELRFEETLVKAFQSGIANGQFVCENPELLASQTTAQVEQWHLKQWKFKMRGVETQEFAKFILDNVLLCLAYKSSDTNSNEGGGDSDVSELD